MSKSVQLKHIINGGLGAKPLPLAIFKIFQQKNSHFSAIWMTFRTIVEPFESAELQT